jgi:hypothetical protein
MGLTIAKRTGSGSVERTNGWTENGCFLSLGGTKSRAVCPIDQLGLVPRQSAARHHPNIIRRFRDAILINELRPKPERFTEHLFGWNFLFIIDKMGGPSIIIIALDDHLNARIRVTGDFPMLRSSRGVSAQVKRAAFPPDVILQVANFREAESFTLFGRHVVKHPIAQMPSRRGGIKCAVLQAINKIKESRSILLIAPGHFSIAIQFPVQLLEKIAATLQGESLVSA